MAAAGSLVVRFRRAQGVERQQLRWVALAAALVPLAALVAVAASLIGGPWPAGWPIAWRPWVMRYHPFRLPTGPWDVTIDGRRQTLWHFDEGSWMAVDGQLVARTVGELRATLPQDGDLLARLGRVVEATRTVVGVDGTGLTLAHEDGRPRWVAVSDAAMELLEQIQHDLGEGPCLAAFAEDRVVAIEDLRRERVWDRVAAVVGQLQVCGVLSVPVRLADQPVGTLDVYVTQPRAWSTGEVEALGALAVVTAELVSTGVELAHREVEVAQLRGALTSRVWIEQAKGVLAATRGVGPDQAFQQLRQQARSSSRKLADLAQEVVQAAQRERVAAKAVDDARVRAAEARARAAEQALQAAQTGLARRAAALDRAQDAADARERAADQRNHLADQRERAADQRNHLADERERAADERNHLADERERAANDRDRKASETE